MKLFKHAGIVACCFLFALSGSDASAQKAIAVKMGPGEAVVTFLKGDVFLVKPDNTVIRAVSEGDRLAQGSRIKTGLSARVELKLPDESFIRFDEQTIFELTRIGFSKKSRKRNMRVRMVLGKTWAKVSKRKAKGRFALATRTAVAGVRGTTYRMNVQADDSVTIKVYWGEILVESQKKQADAAGGSAVQASAKPVPVLGPRPVAGPRPISMEEWVYVVGALQQIDIRPDGTAEKPFRFDIMADLNEWVRWNRDRDKEIGDR